MLCPDTVSVQFSQQYCASFTGPHGMVESPCWQQPSPVTKVLTWAFHVRPVVCSCLTKSWSVLMTPCNARTQPVCRFLAASSLVKSEIWVLNKSQRNHKWTGYKIRQNQQRRSIYPAMNDVIYIHVPLEECWLNIQTKQIHRDGISQTSQVYCHPSDVHY